VRIGDRRPGRAGPRRGARPRTPPPPALPAHTPRPAPRGRPSRGLAAGRNPAAAQPGRSPPSGAAPARVRGLAEQPPAARSPQPALWRYLLRSREATLRQSSKKQNSGYWRQISRPTSSRSRCLSFSPTVRTQGTISVGVAEAVLQIEAEVEATPINLPRLRPAGPAAPHTAADRRTLRPLQPPEAPPEAPPKAPPRVRGRRPLPPLRSRCRPRGLPHDVPEVVTSREALRAPPPFRPPGRVRAPPATESRTALATGLSRKPGGGGVAATSNRLYRGEEREGCARAREKVQPRAAAGPCLRDARSSRGPLGTVVFVTRAGGAAERRSGGAPGRGPHHSPAPLSVGSASGADRSSFPRRPREKTGRGGATLSPYLARAGGTGE
uniref:Uncharacterized protein n=1 Tax=Canis lupus familiaris TaxID=9615 RepID=A0A8C0QMN9_CANLF